MQEKPLSILLVEDNHGDARLIREMLKETCLCNNFEITHTTTLSEAIERLGEGAHDILLLDLDLPDSRGLESFSQVSSLAPKLPVVVLTGLDDADFAVKAVREGAQDYLVKGKIDSQALQRTIRYAIERKKTEEELKRHRDNLEELVRERTSELITANEQLSRSLLEHRKTAEALRESEERFRGIAAAAMDAIIHIDNKGKVVYWNPAAGKMFGYTDEEVMGQDAHNLLAPQRYREPFQMGFPSFRLTGQGPVMGKTMEFTGLRKDGTEFPVEISLSPFLVRGLWHAVGFIRDITDRKQAEVEMRRLAVSVDSAADAVIITDPEGIIQYVNPAFERITGYTRDEVIQKPLGFLACSILDNFFSSLQTLKERGTWEGAFQDHRKDGTPYHAECTISLVKDASGTVINYIISKRDVTERLRLESIAQAVDTMNNIGYIFSGIRHEIGNPINALKMILSVLKVNIARYPQEKIQEFIDRSLAEIAKAEYLLRSLRNFNMYERPEIKKIQLRSFMQDFLSLIRHDFSRRGIQLILSIEENLNHALADPRAIQQVLLNILTNAADACEGREEPFIILSLSRSLDRVLIRVTDNGAGMSGEETQQLFRPFYTTKQQGTGLGLVIVKKMLTSMDSTISVKSGKGVGTCVEILIPGEKNAE
ncbi:MAG: PAS domain S-box protein [Thermodesulfovibrionales bacterium]|jgi:PAS domain S-box-containing protein